MFAGALGQIGRCAVGGLAFVAASYHLTETAHRQADLARKQRRLARQTAKPPADRKDSDSEQRQVLEWLAPDMLDRASPRVLGLDEAVRCSTGGSPGILSAARLRIDRRAGRTISTGILAEDRRPIRRVYLSDRSAHGPPSRA